MQKISIVIIGSHCAVSDSYLEFVREIADSLGIDYTISKTESDEEAERFGVEIGCLYGYCPGCTRLPREDGEHRYTPALAIDGEVVFHTGYPGDDAVRTALQASNCN